MNLLQLRTEFVDRYGLLHLVGISGTSPDYTVDQGANKLLNRAIRFLCDRNPWLGATLEQTYTLETGESGLVVPGLRKPDRLWYYDSTNTCYTPITLVTKEWLRDYFETPAAADSGTPLYWYFIEGVSPSAGDTVVQNIKIFPRADADYSILLSALFKLDELADPEEGDSPSNYVTEHYFDVVVDLAYYFFLRIQGSYQMAAAHLNGLALDLREPAYDHHQHLTDQLADANGLVEIQDYVRES